MSPVPAEAFAYYLPQFYPMELNSTWWGEGFTEWTSVVRAHRGWRSPEGTVLTPGELGFYDLRDARVRARQGELAAAAGLSAFCLYHYWSAGERLLPEVEDAILADGQPDFPFFLGWANHDWTLAWQERADQVTFRQEYDEHVNDDHINRLVDSFDDPRYYRVDGRPLLLVYYPLQVPEHRRVFQRWRDVARERGHEILLLGAAPTYDLPAPEEAGLDAWVQGTSYVFGGMTPRQRALRSARAAGQALRHLRHRDIYLPYDELAGTFDSTLDRFPEPTVPLVVSSWNNVGRRSRRASYTDATPERFAAALSRACERAPVLGSGPDARRLVAVNAWNEWGEGMTMEPSVEFGRGMVEAAGRVLRPGAGEPAQSMKP